MGGACCSEVGRATPAQQASAAAGGYGGVAPGQAQPDWAAPPPQSFQQRPPDDEVQVAPGRAPASSSRGGGADQFISQVGELPKFSSPKKKAGGVIDDSSSEISGISTGSGRLSDVSHAVDGMAEREQKQQAKAVVKEFTKAMVKGRKINVIAPDGSLKSCTVSLGRSLDTMRIKVKSNSRSIPLRDIEEIHAGEATEEIQIQTPLDDLCATLMLPSDESITFRLNDINERDTFVMCLLMFCNNQK